jgi:hypothetical protein
VGIGDAGEVLRQRFISVTRGEWAREDDAARSVPLSRA